METPRKPLQFRRKRVIVGNDRASSSSVTCEVRRIRPPHHGRPQDGGYQVAFERGVIRVMVGLLAPGQADKMVRSLFNIIQTNGGREWQLVVLMKSPLSAELVHSLFTLQRRVFSLGVGLKLSIEESSTR